MRVGRVLGPVWGARHAGGLDGAKLLEVELLGPSTSSGQAATGSEQALGATSARIVAVDALGAGPGELVLVAHGSRVRDLTVGERVADKDVVIAILDGVDVPPPSAGEARR